MNVEAIMQDMINNGADEEDNDYTQYDDTHYEEVHEGYSLDDQPLFGNDGFTQGMGDGVTQDMAEEITQATAETLASSLATTVDDGKKVTQRTSSYTTEEDKLLCAAWIENYKDPLCGAEQKGNAYWARVGKYFHEHTMLGQKPFYTQRSLPCKKVGLHPCRV
jgi:hypothetical protein